MWEAHSVPFSLGYEGEWWSTSKALLVIPIPGTERVVHAARYSMKGGPSGGGFAFVDEDQGWYPCNDMLMLSCMVQEYLSEVV